MMILMDFPYIPLLIGYYYLVSWGLHGITLTHSRGTDQPTIMRCDDSLDDSYPPRNERQKRCRREFLLLYFFWDAKLGIMQYLDFGLVYQHLYFDVFGFLLLSFPDKSSGLLTVDGLTIVQFGPSTLGGQCVVKIGKESTRNPIIFQPWINKDLSC